MPKTTQLQKWEMEKQRKEEEEVPPSLITYYI
jgi:hypothetical protein